MWQRTLAICWDHYGRGNPRKRKGYFSLEANWGLGHSKGFFYYYYYNYFFFSFFLSFFIFGSAGFSLLGRLFSSCSARVSHCSDFSSCGAWALVVEVPRLQRTGSIVGVHKLSCSLACGTFLNQGLNLCFLLWQADSLPLSHQGSPDLSFLICEFNRSYNILFLNHKLIKWVISIAYVLHAYFKINGSILYMPLERQLFHSILCCDCHAMSINVDWHPLSMALSIMK